MLYTLLGISFLGCAIGWGVVKIILTFSSKQIGPKKLAPILQNELLNNSSLTSLLDTVNWEKELSPLIDTQLEKLVETFKQRNPMIAMFLTNEIAGPLKQTGKEELLLMIPKLKKTLVDRLIEDKCIFFISNELSKRILLSMKYDALWRQLQWVGALIGALLGLAGASLYLLINPFV